MRGERAKNEKNEFCCSTGQLVWQSPLPLPLGINTFSSSATTRDFFLFLFFVFLPFYFVSSSCFCRVFCRPATEWLASTYKQQADLFIWITFPMLYRKQYEGLCFSSPPVPSVKQGFACQGGGGEVRSPKKVLRRLYHHSTVAEACLVRLQL